MHANELAKLGLARILKGSKDLGDEALSSLCLLDQEELR